MLAGTSVARSHHVHIDHRSEVTEVIIPQIARDITQWQEHWSELQRHSSSGTVAQCTHVHDTGGAGLMLVGKGGAECPDSPSDLLAYWLRSRGCRPQKGSGRGSGQAGRKNNEGRVLYTCCGPLGSTPSHPECWPESVGLPPSGINGGDLSPPAADSSLRPLAILRR